MRVDSVNVYGGFMFCDFEVDGKEDVAEVLSKVITGTVDDDFIAEHCDSKTNNNSDNCERAYSDTVLSSLDKTIQKDSRSILKRIRAFFIRKKYEADLKRFMKAVKTWNT